jgi:hypothetical protein
MLDDYDTPKRF